MYEKVDGIMVAFRIKNTTDLHCKVHMVYKMESLQKKQIPVFFLNTNSYTCKQEYVLCTNIFNFYLPHSYNIVWNRL